MSWTDIFIKRPVLATCVNLLILLVGVQSIRSLSVRQYPRSDSSSVVVTTAYVGASADLVRGFVTTPLERVIASADGIEYLESSSKQGLSTITARLRLNYNPNDALTQIQAKVAQVRNDLPPEAEVPVIDVQSADSRFASLYFSFYSDFLDNNQITDYLLRVVQPRLSAVPGVQRADILGARTFAMRVWLKPDRMSALGINPADVRAALAANNSLSAIGNTKGSMLEVNLTANTDLRSREEFENLVVRDNGATLIRLRDIADVELGAESYDDYVRFNGQQATFMGIFALPNANVVEVARAARAVFPDIQANLPPGLQASIPYDATRYIEDAIHEVVKTLLETVLIVIIVIYCFIGSLRTVIVPVVAIPLSLVGACALMAAFGFTINLLTLLAIVLAVGIVVDDAIVMLENVERHVAQGMSPLQAAFQAARELTGPIISMTITLAAVYAPIGFQGGLTGALFREFALTLAGAVLISGIVALTLSPMMASRLIKDGAHQAGFQNFLNRFFDRLRLAYRSLLGSLLQTWPLLILGALLITAGAVPLYHFSKKELAPMEDRGVMFGIVQTQPGSSIDQTRLFADKLLEVYRSFPETERTFERISAEAGFAGLGTKPWSQRKRTTMEIRKEAVGKLAAIPGVRIIPVTPPPLPGGSDFPVEFILTTTNEPRELVELSSQLVQKAFASGYFDFAETDLKFDLPQADIIIDRDKIASLGLNLRQISDNLGTLLGGNYVNRFSIDGRSYKVIPQAKRVNRLNPSQLQDLYLAAPDGTLISYASFATIQESVQPRSLNRFQQLNAAKIQGVLSSGTSLDQALSFLEKEARRILPPGFTFDYSGESRQLRTEGSALVTSFVLALIVVYLVLAAQFESFRDPFIILAGSVPLAISGALVMPFLGVHDTTINIYTQVGLITLVGLVSKNGILIVEFANSLKDQGRSKLDAVLEAAATRLRPILMTTVATICGHTPLIFVTGAGAVARNNIGVILVTGMFIGTFFTLFVVPAIYLLVSAESKHPAPAATEPLSTPHEPAPTLATPA